MKLLMVNIYPAATMARYLLSGYVLKAYLQAHCRVGHRLFVEVMNLSEVSRPTDICEQIQLREPDCVAYSCYTWNIEMILDVVEKLRRRSTFTQILGGPEISRKRIESFRLQAQADYYVIGEGERPLARLIERLTGISDSEQQPLPDGVAVWQAGALTYRENRDRISDLDEIPPVYTSGVIGEDLYARRQAFIETQRGCPNRCSYCTYHKNLPTVRYASLARVKAELDWLILVKRVQALRMCDSVFTSDLDRAKTIVQHLLHLKGQRGVRLPWIYWEFTYDSVDEGFIEMVSALKYRERILNSRTVPPADRPQIYDQMLWDYTVVNCVGVQSFHAPALEAVNRRPVDVHKFLTFIDQARIHNIVLKIDLILGLPWETRRTWHEGLEFVLPYLKETDHILNIHRLQVLPGSDLETMCEEYGIRCADQGTSLVTASATFSREEMDRASKEAAVLSRIVNSPLRGRFYAAKQRGRKGFCGIIDDILERILSDEQFSTIPLVENTAVDDHYWNGDIYRDIPSTWLTCGPLS